MGASVTGGLQAADRAAAVGWKVDNGRSIGGRATEVIGAPRVVAGAVGFNGASDGLLVAANPLAGLRVFTVEGLVRPAEGGPPEQRFWHAQDTATSRALVETRVDGMGSWWLDTYLMSVGQEGRTLIDPKRKHATEKWSWVALRYGGKTMAHFVNGRRSAKGPWSLRRGLRASCHSACGRTGCMGSRGRSAKCG